MKVTPKEELIQLLEMTAWNIVCWVIIAITSYIGLCVVGFAIVAIIIDYVKRKKQESE